MTDYIIDKAKSPKALVIFAHGAGADKSSSFMDAMALALVAEQISVLRFNFDYMNKRLVDGKRYPPERMPKLLSAMAQVINEQSDELPLFLAGKSMGGRVAATITSQLGDVDELIGFNAAQGIKGTICYGYPFHPSAKPGSLRLAPLQERIRPVIIIQGERDKLGDRAEIECYEVAECCQIHFVEDGDHDLKPRVKSGFTHQAHIKTAAKVTSNFIDQTILGTQTHD